MLITNKASLEQFNSNHRVWQGIPGIARTKNGRTFISFYSGGTYETYGNYAALLKSDIYSDFGEPIAVAKKEGAFRCFDPVLWIDPLDRLWFIWNVMPGEDVYASICENPDADELVWGEEFYIGRGIMMNKPVVLSTGEWLFPIAIWKTNICNDLRKSGLKQDEQAGSYVYKTSDNGKSFVCLGVADVYPRVFDEHMVIELKNGVLMMLVRTTYGIGASYSYDRGKNWSNGTNSNLDGPCSRFYISRLKSGRILLINHFNFKERDHLTALLSEDDGKTFPYSLLLDERDSVSYPDAMEAADGYIYITYDRERGGFKKSLAEAYACAREILTAKITEEDIINGRIVDNGSFLKNAVSKLDKLSAEDGDPYVDATTDIEAFVDDLLKENKNTLEKVFAKYPVTCIDMAKLDTAKLDKLIDTFHKHDDKDKKTLLKIIAWLRATTKYNTDPSPIIENIKQYIENHLAEDIIIADVAKEFNVSIYYLSHLFKSVTGTTLLEFRNELRLTKAKQLLTNSDETIGEIAHKCGFNNASYFTELFTRSEKISPSDYKKFHKKY